MKKFLGNNRSHANDGIVSKGVQREGDVSSRQDKIVNRSRNTCEKIKLGYNGSSRVGSNSHNRNGEFTMNKTTDPTIETIHTKIDSYHSIAMERTENNHRVAMERTENNHKVAMERTESNHKVAMERIEGNHRTVLAEIQGLRGEMQSQFQVILAKIQASEKSTRLWFIVTLAGLAATGFAVWRILMGG